MNKNFVNIPLSKYIKLNNELSTQYVQEKDVIKRRHLIKLIYELDIPLFKCWQVFTRENREDFEQEAYLWIERALATFKPTAGSFISWLKTYWVKKSWTAEQARHQKEQVFQQLTGDEDVREDDVDNIYWEKVKKLCSEEEWRILYGLMFEGKSVSDMASEIGKKYNHVLTVKSEIFQRIKDMHFKAQQIANTNQDNFGVERWIPLGEFGEKMHYTYQHTRMLVSTSKKRGYYIDPRDIILKPVVRIRYLSRDAGLVYPRFCYRTRPAKCAEEQTESDS